MSTNKYDNKFKKKFAELKPALRRHEKNISLIVNDFLTNPKQTKTYWNTVKSKLNKEYREILKLDSIWAYEEIPKQYRFVLREQMAKSKKLKSITNEAKKSISQLLKSNDTKKIQREIAQSAVDDISGGLLLGRRDLNRLMNQVKTGTSVDNKLLRAAKNERFITIIDKNKDPRRYGITYYSEMVFRTKWHEAQSAAVVTNNKNWDTDLIRVSNHNTATKICQAFEGKIFSLEGKNKDFPIADDVPPYHPNCLHYITTTFEEALKAQGNYKEYSDFSKDKINKPPGQETFIPVKKRNRIIDKTVSDVKTTDLFQNATPKRKRIILRDSVSKALGKAA
jgi:hypothetical protein